MMVLIAGGGIGGLALAQGLLRYGVAVTVLERDADVSSTGGYKLHLGPTALTALAELLPPALMRELTRCSVATTGFTLAVRDHRGRLLLRARDEGEGESLDVDRITLRRLLAAGLGERLRMGAVCASYAESDAGVQVRLRSGETVDGDLLVIAEGAGSGLAEQLAGGPTGRSTGLVGLAGRTPTAALSAAAQSLLRDDPMLGFGPGGLGLFASWHAPSAVPAQHGTTVPSAPEPVVIWGLITAAAQLPRALPELGKDELAGLAASLLESRRWRPQLVELPRRAQPETLGGFRFLAADPDRIAPWTPRRVTAIGDAAHVMPPTGGRGAATAIIDAHRLTVALADVAGGRLTVSAALQSATDEMRDYAARAVRESLQPVRWITASAHPLARPVATVALPVAAGIAGAARRLSRRSR